MSGTLKKVLIAVVSVVVVVLAASFVYAKFINKADEEFDSSDVKDRLSTTVPQSDTGTGTGTGGEVGGVDGSWTIAAGSEVGYRVDEVVNGFSTTANGRTTAISGTFSIDGAEVTEGSFTVDMTTFASDSGRRDGQFNGRIMSVGTFPTATFALTAPIDFRAVPTDGSTITASATGDLTLRGVTLSVTFDVEATFQSGRIGVLGQIPIVFADYGIPNPSVATVSTEDHGLLEFVLIFDRTAISP